MNDEDPLQKTAMRLLLVRHGESVDNVAGVYAGSRDSVLTAHGVLQARRLGGHLTREDDGEDDGDNDNDDRVRRPRLVVSHVFSSDLQRAVQTAEAIVEAHKKARTAVDRDGDGDGDGDGHTLAVVQLAVLRERDFRSGEGRRIGSSSSSSSSVFADAETREEMRRRAERFVDEHLQPLLATAGGRVAVANNRRQAVVVVVSHGIFLGVLLSAVLQRFAPSEPSEPAVSVSAAPVVSWSNTGYVELQLAVVAASPGVSLVVTATNCVEHLQGLQKTRGGIGSAAFDAKQRTMDSFFGPAAKRQKKGGLTGKARAPPYITQYGTYFKAREL